MKKDKKQDTYSYKGWLNSDFFLKRMCAVIGYTILGSLFFWIICFATFILSLLLLSTGLGLFNTIRTAMGFGG